MSEEKMKDSICYMCIKWQDCAAAFTTITQCEDKETLKP
jgi:hypothetical protein